MFRSGQSEAETGIVGASYCHLCDVDMSGHLPILQSMFPGKLMLDADDIASCMQVSTGHIYNLVSKKTLPIKINHGLGNRVMVSIVQMAQYLDSRLLDSAEKVISVQEPEGKKKVGRPRRSTKARLEVQLFQSSIRAAIYKADALKGMATVIQFVDQFQSAVRSLPAHDSHLNAEVLTLRAQLDAVAVELRLAHIKLEPDIESH